jgi:hypothetical protein
LESAGLKLVRAGKHLESLRYEVARFKNSHPYRIVTGVDLEAEERFAYAVMERNPDHELSLILGDLVHNLRGALDHAVFGLSELLQERHLPDTEAKSVKFPIWVDPDDLWPGKKTGAWPYPPSVRFLSERLQKWIDVEQPYRGPDETTRLNDPLAVLYAINNADKHRQLLLVGTLRPKMLVGVSREAVNAVHATPAVVENGSEVVRVPLGLDPTEHLSPYVIVNVALQTGGPIRNPIATTSPLEGLADSMFRTVADVLNAFGGPLQESDFEKSPIEHPASAH